MQNAISVRLLLLLLRPLDCGEQVQLNYQGASCKTWANSGDAHVKITYKADAQITTCVAPIANLCLIRNTLPMRQTTPILTAFPAPQTTPILTVTAAFVARVVNRTDVTLAGPKPDFLKMGRSS
jgi:hypothetical protein